MKLCQELRIEFSVALALIHVLAHFQRTTCSQIYFRFSSYLDIHFTCILFLLNNTCVKHNFKSVHVSNLFWSREYTGKYWLYQYCRYWKNWLYQYCRYWKISYEVAKCTCTELQIIFKFIYDIMKTAKVDEQKTKYLQHFINKHDTIVSNKTEIYISLASCV
jgi:hypothetical protein